MAQIKKIFFPVDFSEKCDASAEHVAGIAQQTGAEVVLFYSVEPLPPAFAEIDPGAFNMTVASGDAKEEFKRELDKYQLERFAKIPHKRVLKTGDPGINIVEAARYERADLIMIPSHGLSPFRRFLLGSVTAKVLHDAVCPVWTSAHRERDGIDKPFRIRKVLAGIDLTPCSPRVLRYARDFAEQFAADVGLLHVIPATEERLELYFDGDFRGRLIQEARDRLAQLQIDAGTNFPVQIRSGELGHQFHDACMEAEADLVVIGRGHVKENGFGRLRTHSYELIREAPCPVISV